MQKVCGWPLEDYQGAQDKLVEARNRLARAIPGAAMSGMTQDEIVEATDYDSEQILRICRRAGISEAASAPSATTQAGQPRRRWP
jgi:hypothetical protein